MKVVLDQMRRIATGEEYTFSDPRTGTHRMTGPGYVHFTMVEQWDLKERRDISTTEFRFGGKRKYDREERRFTTNVLRAQFFHRRKGDDRRVNGMYRRRPGKGDIRFGRRAADPLRFVPVAHRWGRRSGDADFHRPERRIEVLSHHKRYSTSADPRIRALERRK